MIQTTSTPARHEAVSLAFPQAAAAEPEDNRNIPPRRSLARGALANFTAEQLGETLDALTTGAFNTKQRELLYLRVLENHRELSQAPDRYLNLCEALGGELFRSLQTGGVEEREAALRLFRRWSAPSAEIHPDLRNSAARYMSGVVRALTRMAAAAEGPRPLIPEE